MKLLSVAQASGPVLGLLFEPYGRKPGSKATATQARRPVPLGVSLILSVFSLSLAYGYDVSEHETIHQAFPAASWIEVDNVHGHIHVTGYNGSAIEMTVEKTIEADSSSRMDAARREVKLDTTQSGDRLKLFVDGPFRCHCGDGNRGVNESGRRGYRVIYDFELKVPQGTSVDLATVNKGKIEVKDVAGDFDISNVNGAIELDEMAGSGKAHTVNGGVNVAFAKNPAKNCSFQTVNGGIEVSFRPDLAADVRVKTFNGDAYTEFEATALPVTASAERRDGKFVYRSNRFSAFRIGNGGPELKFDTLNGSVRIINRGR